ncbi:MAG: acetyl-CoA C-acetyltransferase [Cellvibrionaceae bacterium]|jgi:acetyl-CoA C-acetyltransferase
MNSDIVIVSAARTPMGAFQGALSSVTAPDLGATVIKAVIARSGVDKDQIDEVLMGNVLSAGVGQAPARQAALNAGLSQATSATTIGKVCGSGMKSVMLAFDQIKAGSIELAIAGGMENMSLAPYFLPKARAGQRLGHGEIVDHMFYDGLQNAYDGQLMGCFADANSMADKITREHMDDYAIESLKRAQLATSRGYFDEEISPVTYQTRKGDITVYIDESPQKAVIEKIPTLRPAFGKDGLVTAANASSISDGAAALMVMSAAKAKSLNLTPLAVIKAHTSHAREPERFTHAPIDAIKKLLTKVNWTVADVDLFEVNEAFAMVAIAAINALKLPREKVNINGGATALGHPIGASGARIIVTLLYALQRIGKTKGVASICIGGGEATAIAIELT